MAVKKCFIEKCTSCSTRKEDLGVTYHRYPKDLTLRGTWIEVTRYKFADINLATYVCSRHFRKSDFQIYKDSKYVLKPDAIPSIFPWSITKINKTNMETLNIDEETNKDPHNSSKETEGENLDAIKKYIEDQEKEIYDKEIQNEEIKEITDKEGAVKELQKNNEESLEDRMAVATSMMDVILSESEAMITKKVEKHKQFLSSNDKGNGSMALSVGSKVEAKDFGEYWYQAQIVEVDYDEMEVLVHYENLKKHDEWISVSSPRLRPIGSGDNHPSTSQPSNEVSDVPPTTELEPKPVKEEPRMDEKTKQTFVVGERCLVKWRDNRRFMATVKDDLGNGNFEIMFDDGFKWTCNTSRMYKFRSSGKMADNLTVDTTSSPGAAVSSPIQHGGPSNPLVPPYHTHLFDPKRDYLGSKSERREMKRKLNIKEIFNIGQKRQKKEKPKVAVGRKPKVVRKRLTLKRPVETVQEHVKNEIPDAVASIIGTVKDESVKEETEAVSPEVEKTEEPCHKQDEPMQELVESSNKVEEKSKEMEDTGENKLVGEDITEKATDQPIEDCNKVSDTTDASDLSDNQFSKIDDDHIPDEEIKLEKFDKQDEGKHEEVIDKIKEVITKIEDDLNKVENVKSPKPELKVEKVEKVEPVKTEDVKVNKDEVKEKKKLSKIKKGKKLRLLQEKKVKKQVEKVKSELEEMKKQVEEMKKQMMLKAEELAEHKLPESFLLPGEWCCKWVNGQPVGKVSELESEVKDGNCKPGLPRRSVQVEDKRLPEGWTKHMVRRSMGHSAGKWDVVLVNPENRRFHTKNEIRLYMENNPSEELLAHEHALLDFGVHLKLSRRIGWVTTTPGGGDTTPVTTLPAGTLCSTSPLIKRKKLSLKSQEHSVKEKKRKFGIKGKIRRNKKHLLARTGTSSNEAQHTDTRLSEPPHEAPVLEDGYVYVGSLKVQIIENLLRCPAEGCYKNFRNNTLLQMHIKHYHRELRKLMGRTPKVLDLAYARTMPTDVETPRAREPELKTIKIKLPRLPKRIEEAKLELKEPKLEITVETPTTPVKTEPEIPKQDSPKLRNALVNKPVKRPKVLLPVRRVQTAEEDNQIKIEGLDVDVDTENEVETMSVPCMDVLDFETAISTHTVTKPLDRKVKDGKKGLLSRRPISEDDEWFSVNSDVETRSSFPRSETPDSKYREQKPVSSESNEEQKEADMYMYTETGERIKLVHMKREEIINCSCGFREEDGLMVQCELCLCWQHALCHQITCEAEVPEKYTCSICLNPRRGRRSARFRHAQEPQYEGRLPGAPPREPLRRAHELAGNLLRLRDALHVCRLNYHVATKKNHPKLYLWAKDWDNTDVSFGHEKLNSDYSDLSIIINNIGKENLPVKDEMKDGHVMNIDDENDRFGQRDGAQNLLSGLLSSPGGASLDFPITTSDLERLAKTVQEQEMQRASGPQPEAAIDNAACRERLLRHIQRCQALVDARLDSIEAQVAELESQDPSFEDDETADYFPRTKQTIQMLMRDLDTMEELGAST